MNRFAVVFAMCFAMPALAQPGPVQGRIDNQQQRINQGVATGQLTPAEAHRDEAHLRQDQRIRNRDLAAHGGHLTPAEKARLNARLNNNSARVYDTKHNPPAVPPQ